MNPRHRLFAQAKAIGHSSTDSAVLAGYSPQSARKQGSRLMQTNPDITEHIDALQARIADKQAVDTALVIEATLEVVQRCMQAVEATDKAGKPTGQYVFDAQGALKGLKLLGDYTGAWANAAGGGGDTYQTLNVLATLTLDELKQLAGPDA